MALQAIGEQGEGPQNPPAGGPTSHFDHFIEIYRAFPESHGLRVPTRPVTDRPDDQHRPRPGSRRRTEPHHPSHHAGCGHSWATSGTGCC